MIDSRRLYQSEDLARICRKTATDQQTRDHVLQRKLTKTTHQDEKSLGMIYQIKFLYRWIRKLPDKI